MPPQIVAAFAFALVLPSARAATVLTAADREKIAKLTDQMIEANHTGKKANETPRDLCDRTKPIWEAGRVYRNVKDDTFRLARALFAKNRRTDWKCPLTDADKVDPAAKRTSLWDRFDDARKSLELASSPEEQKRRQEALRAAALSLLRELDPTAAKYQDVVDSLALSVAPKDKVAALQAIIVAVGPGDLAGDKGKMIADAVSKLAQQIPPKMFTEKQVDDLISFAIQIARQNPKWLQQESAGRLLGVVLRSLGELPPEKVGEEQAQAVFDFTAKLLAQDPHWLDGPRAAMLAQLVPGLLAHIDIGKVKPEDVSLMLKFTTKVVAGRANWPAEVRQLIDDWEKIVQIALETKNPATRAIIQKAVLALQQREGDAYKPLAEEVSKAQPDPQVIASLLEALGVSRVEKIRQEQAALERLEIVSATFLRLRTSIGLRLPEGCHERHRDDSATCKSVFAFVDAFRRNIVSGGPEGADFGPEIETGIPDALARGECTLLPPAARKEGCQPYEGYENTFASFIALDISRPVQNGAGALVASAGCVVVSAGRVAHRVPQVGLANFGDGPEHEHDAIIAAEGLATKILNRCPLSKPHNDFATELLAKGRVDPDLNASSALVFAGLPYLRDARVPTAAARAVSAADFITLAAAAGGMVAGIYVHNTNDGPWGDRLLQIGLVSLGVNILLKVGAAGFYALHYGHP